MNTYEEKQEARKARFEELAMNARREADALARQSRDMLKGIPFGQPIRGERDRRFRNCTGNFMRDKYAGEKQIKTTIIYLFLFVPFIEKSQASGSSPSLLRPIRK